MNAANGAAAESAVAEVEAARELFRSEGRAALGVIGDENSPPLRRSIRESKAGWYPLLALSALVIIDEGQGVAFGILGPEISSALGISKGALAGMVALKTLALSLATLPMAAYVQKHPRRAAVAIVTAFLWSAITMFTGLVRRPLQMMGILVADGATTGSVAAVHIPLFFDTYPPEVRVRGLAFYRMSDNIGRVLAPLLVGALSAIAGLTWRGIFVVMGLASLITAVFSIGLRDPGFGRWDTQRIREIVRSRSSDRTDLPEEKETHLGFFEIARRLFLIPTVRKIFAINGAVGMMIIPLATFMAFFLDEHWNLGPGGRGAFGAAIGVFPVMTLALFGKKGEQLFRRDPAQLMRFGGIMGAVGLVCLAVSVMSPWFSLMAIFFAISSSATAALVPALSVATQGIIPPRMRPHAAALSGIFLSAVGGLGGLILLGGIDEEFGVRAAILAITVPGFIGMWILHSTGNTINDDLNLLVDNIVEEEEIRSMSARGVHLPMLACRSIDFSYDKVQVLFDVDFTVDDGEMVALLGTNGAGKSTLLKVVSGLGLPTKGTVRFRGADVTYLDAERRVKLGITQVPGGRSVFGPLTVVENLRLFGYTHGRNKAVIERAIEESLDIFPQLAKRRNQVASTLSGGEQQMLGLSRAMILRPQLLLIDELSLGLAPKIVAELLEMTRRINRAGTAVVLVEQSVNVALSVAEHGYFMEKGEIRFDGKSADLLAREDLLRSVFLQGATKGLR